jgi:hypothetical protein
MYEKNEGQMGMHHGMGKKSDWITKKMIWESSTTMPRRNIWRAN